MRIDINGIEWGINFVSHSNDHMMGSNGLCSYEENNIYIARDMPKTKIRRTLIHELTHAVEYSFGLRDRQSDNKYEDLANFLMFYGELIINIANDIMNRIDIEDRSRYDKESIK